MSISFEYYRIFYYVAKYQNITLASKALFLSQPTVSHYIQSLETELGCLLFMRSKKGVILTPEAALLYEHVSKACAQIFKAEEELLAIRSLSEGTLRIGASEMTLHNYLIPYLEIFRKKYPNVKLKILNHSTLSAIETLKTGLLDFAIIISPIPHDPELHITKLEAFQDIAIAGNAFSHLKDKPCHLKELMSYPLIMMAEETATRRYFENFFLAHDLVLTPDIELATTDQISPIVKHNLGIGFVPFSFARPFLNTGEVFQLDLIEKIAPRHICLAYHHEIPLCAAGEKFLELLVPNSN